MAAPVANPTPTTPKEKQVSKLSTGDIAKRVGWPVPAAFIIEVLKVVPTEKIKAATYWTEEQVLKEIFPKMRKHIAAIEAGKEVAQRTVRPKKAEVDPLFGGEETSDPLFG
jgi:hypothetical protein